MFSRTTDSPPIALRARRGFLAPALGMAVLVSLLVAAVVLNLQWRRIAAIELAASADAAALAAVGALACDERLLDEALPTRVLEDARTRADRLAGRYRIAGQRAQLVEDSPRFGRQIVDANQRTTFLETEHLPTVVRIAVGRGPEAEFPWLLRMAGQSEKKLIAAATAEIRGGMSVLRPRASGTVPVWPIAVRAWSPSDGRSAVADRVAYAAVSAEPFAVGGSGDQWRYDSATQRVVSGEDGLPECTLATLPSGGELDDVGLVPVDTGHRFRIDRLSEIMQRGCERNDLSALGGVVPIEALRAQSVSIPAMDELPPEVSRNWKIGQVRAIFQFRSLRRTGGDATGLSMSDSAPLEAELCGVVGARLMQLKLRGDGAWEAVIQPAVLATSTATTDSRTTEAATLNTTAKDYFYNLRLIR